MSHLISFLQLTIFSSLDYQPLFTLSVNFSQTYELLLLSHLSPISADYYYYYFLKSHIWNWTQCSRCGPRTEKILVPRTCRLLSCLQCFCLFCGNVPLLNHSSQNPRPFSRKLILNQSRLRYLIIPYTHLLNYFCLNMVLCSFFFYCFYSVFTSLLQSFKTFYFNRCFCVCV